VGGCLRDLHILPSCAFSAVPSSLYRRSSQAELVACKPPPSASFAASLAASATRGSTSTTAAPQPCADPALLSAVCRGISSTIKALVAKSEAAVSRAHIGAAIAIAEHCLPTPVQQTNLVLAARFDELRHGICCFFADVPPPSQLSHLLAVEESDPSVVALSEERSRVHPLRPHLPPALLSAIHLLRVGRGTPEVELVAQVWLLSLVIAIFMCQLCRPACVCVCVCERERERERERGRQSCQHCSRDYSNRCSLLMD
jgi:hypothetical protein